MPTAYDDFTGNASDTCMTVSDEAIVNRRILREAMERSGFRHLSSEWWHFDFVDWKKYPVTDIPFEKLKEQ
jgi:D-alanyl-D-alanine dipeptidase